MLKLNVVVLDMQVRLYDSKLINKNVFVAFTFQSLDRQSHVCFWLC